jgi:VanZ family protein
VFDPIIHATLSSINARPGLTSHETALVTYLERFGAYAVLGIFFYLAYPCHIASVCLLVTGSAILLEVLQLFTPDRDARVVDALEKIGGGVVGVLTARTCLLFVQRRGWMK